MHTNDQNLLIIGSVENADTAALRQILRRAPQKIVLQFRSTRMLEAEHLTALGIDAGHHMTDRAILACRIHRLKNQQHRIAVGCVVQALQFTQLLNMFFKELLILLLRLVNGLHQCRPLIEVDPFTFLDLVIV